MGVVVGRSGAGKARTPGYGLVEGFQWIDGSFLEHVESTEGRDPRDIDVVTFFRLPDGKNQSQIVQSSKHLFEPDQSREMFYVDAYFVSL